MTYDRYIYIYIFTRVCVICVDMCCFQLCPGHGREAPQLCGPKLQGVSNYGSSHHGEGWPAAVPGGWWWMLRLRKQPPERFVRARRCSKFFTAFVQLALALALGSLGHCACTFCFEDMTVIADMMFAWARERGAIDFAHWFFPMRGGGGDFLKGNTTGQRKCRCSDV